MSIGQQYRPNLSVRSLRDLLDGVEGVRSSEIPDVKIGGISLDSLDIEPSWLFVGVPGEHHHGARFAANAIKQGAVAVVTDMVGAAHVNGTPTIIVEDPRSVAAELALRFYGDSYQHLKTVAVTGTNGKTTTSYMVRSALSSTCGEVGLMATGMIDVDGRPQYMLRTTAEAPVVQRGLAVAAEENRGAVVVEASAHAMSLGRLDGLVFDAVAFTNLQHDHLDYYHTMDNYFQAKALLFTPEHARAGVVCTDDSWGRRLASEASIPIVTVSALTETPSGVNMDRHWSVSWFGPREDRWGTAFTLVSPEGIAYEAFSPIPGAVNVQNAAVAILAATQAGVPIEEAIRGVSHTPPVAGRMELVPSDEARQPRVLVDYAHTPEALRALLETVRPLVRGHIILVFGTDGDRDASKREELGQIAAEMADILWVTDENPRTEDPASIRAYLMRGIASVRPTLEGVTEVSQCRRDATRMAIQAASAGDLVMITGKGSEASQEIMGVFHAYSDTIVATEVLTAPL